MIPCSCSVILTKSMITWSCCSTTRSMIPCRIGFVHFDDLVLDNVLDDRLAMLHNGDQIDVVERELIHVGDLVLDSAVDDHLSFQHKHDLRVRARSDDPAPSRSARRVVRGQLGQPGQERDPLRRWAVPHVARFRH
jgi:hypothetical protein